MRNGCGRIMLPKVKNKNIFPYFCELKFHFLLTEKIVEMNYIAFLNYFLYCFRYMAFQLQSSAKNMSLSKVFTIQKLFRTFKINNIHFFNENMNQSKILYFYRLRNYG